MSDAERRQIDPGGRPATRLRAARGVLASYMHERSDRHRIGEARSRDGDPTGRPHEPSPGG